MVQEAFNEPSVFGAEGRRIAGQDDRRYSRPTLSGPTPPDPRLIATIRDRWSPKRFADRAVARTDIDLLLEAARWAPSCYNEQPWRFVVTTREAPDPYRQLLDCLAEKNRQWASTAPVLILSAVSERFRRNDSPNRWAAHDLGLAVGNLLNQATFMGLYVHQMGGFDADRARQTFGIPEGHALMAVLAIGYLGDRLPEGVSERDPNDRAPHPRATFAFDGAWGQSREG